MSALLNRLEGHFIMETDFQGEPLREHTLLNARLKPCPRYWEEAWGSVLPELKELLPAHYEELSVTKDEYSLDPAWDRYDAMNAAKMLHIVTARDGPDLIGYVIFMVHANLHYRTCKMAVEDIYYLKPEYRKGRTGINLFKFFEETCRKMHVNRIVVTTKVHLDNSRLFEYLGYKFFEKSYTKMLG